MKPVTVNGSHEMIEAAIRTVAAETECEGARYSVKDATHTDYRPCLVVRIDKGPRSGWIGQLALQPAPRGFIVKELPERSDYDPDGKLFEHFKLEMLKEFGRRGIMPQASSPDWEEA